MKKVFLPACIVAIISLSACGGTPQPDTSNSIVQPATSSAIPAVADTSKNVFQGSTKADAATAALNPEHGKPNHRCDIAVGAPLNSPVQQVQPGAQAGPTMPVQTNPGTVTLNPAHGQPGHDCAIPVGQPLKS